MKTLKTPFLFLAFALVFVPGLTSIAFAQDDPEKQTSEFSQKAPNVFEKQDVWGVGLQAGLLSGMGVGVRFHPQGRFGLQFVGGLISSGGATPYNFGFEGQFDFDARGLSRFYGYLGGGYYSNGKTDITPTLENPKPEKEELEGPLRLGIGFAYEWPIAATIIFNLNLGITWFSDGAILPLPQASVFYYFN